MIRKVAVITKKTRKNGEIYFVASIQNNIERFEKMEDAMAWLDRIDGYEIVSEEIVYEEEIRKCL